MATAPIALPPQSHLPARLMRYPLAAVGFSATIAQVVMIREMVATFYGNELLFGLALGAWLAWGALGSWGLSKLAAFRHLGIRAFAVLLALMGALLSAQITLVRAARLLLGVTPGAFVEFGPTMAAVFVSLAPLCLVGGALFALGARLTVDAGGSAGHAYVWESAGALVGGLLFSFFLIHWLDPYQTALGVAVVDLIMAGSLWMNTRLAPSSPPRWPLFAILSAFLLLAFPLGGAIHEVTLSWQWDDLVFVGDSPYGRLTIQARDGQRVFYENGLLAFETQGTFPEEVTHFPLLAHSAPEHVLLIGGGVAGDLRESLKHPLSTITYVELDPLVISAAQAHLPPEEAIILKDPRISTILTDGRLFVKECAEAQVYHASSVPDQYEARPVLEAVSPCTFDVIIIDLPEPATGALNRFYTQQFFAEASAILNPGGILSFGLPSSENYWSPELARRNASVYYTLQAVFPYLVVLPGEYNFYLASNRPLESDAITLSQRLAERGVQTRWVTSDYIAYVLNSDRYTTVQRELASHTGVRLNEDLKPICYYYNMALWLSLFYPHLRAAFEGVGLLNLWWMILPLLPLLGLARWRRDWAAPIVIAGVGLAQMVLEMVILFAFQVLHGYVYAQVSLIITAFMGGLALGGGISNRLLLKVLSASERGPRGALLGVLGGVVVYSAALPFILRLPIPSPGLAFPLLALLAGMLTGMAFPLAVALVSDKEEGVPGVLYAADLLGGCMGALLGVTLLVPVLGLPQTCMIVAMVGVAGLLALV